MAMTIVVQEADRGIRIDDLGSIYTVNRKKHQNVFVIS